MPNDSAEPAASETEPDVATATRSDEVEPGQKPPSRVAGPGFGPARLLLLLAGGVAVGYGAIRLIRGRGRQTPG